MFGRDQGRGVCVPGPEGSHTAHSLIERQQLPVCRVGVEGRDVTAQRLHPGSRELDVGRLAPFRRQSLLLDPCGDSMLARGTIGTLSREASVEGHLGDEPPGILPGCSPSDVAILQIAFPSRPAFAGVSGLSGVQPTPPSGMSTSRPSSGDHFISTSFIGFLLFVGS